MPFCLWLQGEPLMNHTHKGHAVRYHGMLRVKCQFCDLTTERVSDWKHAWRLWGKLVNKAKNYGGTSEIN